MGLGPLRRLALITELTPRPPTLRDFKGGHTREQSGTSVDHDILRRGDGDVRTALYEAANPMMTRSQKHAPCRRGGCALRPARS